MKATTSIVAVALAIGIVVGPGMAATAAEVANVNASAIHETVLKTGDEGEIQFIYGCGVWVGAPRWVSRLGKIVADVYVNCADPQGYGLVQGQLRESDKFTGDEKIGPKLERDLPVIIQTDVWYRVTQISAKCENADKGREEFYAEARINIGEFWSEWARGDSITMYC